MSTKRTHSHTSLSRKFEILQFIENNPTKSHKDVAEMFKIPAQTLSGWWKKKEVINKNFSNSELSLSMKRFNPSKYKQVDNDLLTWFCNMRERNEPIDGETLRLKAQDLLNASEEIGMITASWVKRWKKRHNIGQMKLSGESASVCGSVVENWRDNQLKFLLQNFQPECIFNADETGLFWKLLPERTLHFKGQKCQGGKKSKERITLLCASIAGEKLPLLVVGKFANPRCFKNRNLPEDIDYKSNSNAWMTTDIFVYWLRKFDRKNAGMKRKVALVLDNCTAHPQLPDLTNTQLFFLPPKTTSKIRPLDAGVIRNLKFHYRNLLVRKRLHMIDCQVDYSIDLLQALKFLSRSWYKVSSETVINCFRHVGFRDDNEIEEIMCENEDFQNFQSNIESLVSGVTVQDYLSIDDNVFVVETAFASNEVQVVQERVEAANESDDDAVPQINVKKQVFQALEILEGYCDQEGSSSLRNSFKNFSDSFWSVVNNQKNQKLITDFFN